MHFLPTFSHFFACYLMVHISDSKVASVHISHSDPTFSPLLTASPMTTLCGDSPPISSPQKAPLAASKTLDESVPILGPSNIHPNTETSESRGYLFMLLSAVAHSTASILSRIAEHRYNLPATACVLHRAIVQLLLSFLYILRFLNFRYILSSLTPRHWLLLALRGVFSALGILTIFNSFQVLPVGDAVAIYFCSPVIAMLLSALLLSESVSVVEIVCSIVSLSGVLLISRPDFSMRSTTSERLWGCANAFASAFLLSSGFVMVRLMGTSVHFMMSVLSPSLIGVPVAIMAGGTFSVNSVFYNQGGTFFMLLATLSGFAGQSCSIQGMQHCRAGPALLTSTLEVPFVYGMGLLFLGEKPSWASLTGSCLVMGTAVFIGWRRIAK